MKKFLLALLTGGLVFLAAACDDGSGGGGGGGGGGKITLPPVPLTAEVMIAPSYGEKYHRLPKDYNNKQCRTLTVANYTSDKTRAQVEQEGYEACKVCKPDGNITVDK